MALEDRIVLAAVGYTPAQIRHAYGFDRVVFNAGGVAIPGDGRGTTIALFEVGDTPDLLSSLDVFDHAFNLPDPVPWQSGSPLPLAPYLTKIGVDGAGELPPPGDSQGEALLDTEWVHAVAPEANILVVEANSTSQLPQADALAARQPGVVVVSNSYSTYDYRESPHEVADNSAFTTPPGHPGVTFVDSSGDTGDPSHPPNFSPNVLSVGGTSLTLDASGNYGSETAWAGSGGGLSLYEPRPAYQRRVLPRGVVRRAVPDVAIVANKATGVSVYNPADGGWTIGGGTSLGAPLWAAIIAIADQGRALRGLGSLDGATQTLPDLYHLPRRDFHAITEGDNGFRAHRGYNLITGLGTPYVARVVAGLVASTAVYPAPRTGKILHPPASYYAPSGPILHATAGSAFNGILATVHLNVSSAEAGTVTTTVDWGDGTVANSTPIDVEPIGFGVDQVRTIPGSPGRKTYTSPGTYAIDIALTLPSGSTLSFRKTIIVSPAPLTIASQPIGAIAGATFSGTVATFTNATLGLNPGPSNPGDTYTATIRWGDGTHSPGTITPRPSAPGFLVNGEHVYKSPRISRVSVHIREDVPGRSRPVLFRTQTLAVTKPISS